MNLKFALRLIPSRARLLRGTREGAQDVESFPDFFTLALGCVYRLWARGFLRLWAVILLSDLQQGSPTPGSDFKNRLHSRRWAVGKVSEASSAAPYHSHYWLNHTPSPRTIPPPCPSLWKNCLPWNSTLLTRRLSTSDLENTFGFDTWFMFGAKKSLFHGILHSCGSISVFVYRAIAVLWLFVAFK